MATNTTNYGWTKPSYEDAADIEVINGTIDNIDAQLKTVETALNSKQNALSSAQLAAVNSGIDSAKVAQIETNKNNIADIKDGTSINSFGDVETALGSKQNTISDLATIRSGAALGATAVQPETGKGLSTNDYTTAEKTKLDNLAEIKTVGTGLNLDDNGELTATGGGSGGTTNYNDLSNKPQINGNTLSGNKTSAQLGLASASDIPTTLADLSGDSTHRTVSDTEKAAWNNKSDFSGSYNDLTNKPTIPDELSDLTEDATHRTVTDTEKSTWNGKQSALSSAQLAAVNSGIDRAKVAQIETNKNNISSIQSSQGLLLDTTTIIGTDWTLTTIVLDAPTNAIVDMTVTLIYGEKAPRGIYINRSNISATGGIAKIEDSSNAVQLRLSATGVKVNGVNKYYVWVKSTDTGKNPVYLMYRIYE